jgi:putative two-component system response regulator
VLAENYYARLLIEISDYDGAMTHARAAREFASKSKSPRSDIQASVAEGLAEAFSGNLDVGISRLTATLGRAKALKLASREVLVALVKALEFAGRHDEALKYLQEMLSQQRKTAEANVLHHVHQHLIQLHSADANSPIEDVKQVMRRMETRAEVLEGRVAKAEVIKQRQELFKARIEAMERLAVAAELRDDSTGEHSYRVGRMACLLAKEAGCDEETIFMIDIAARLHDVGKIGIPDGILLKPRGFNPAERAVMEMHAEIGADVLAKSEIPHIKMAEEIARHHHERWDGKGYPAKIGGREIPLAARITALADVYDALTHKRPYKEAWTVEATLSEMLASRGSHFDPELTDLFLALVSRLRRETRDLDHFLGEAARASPFIQARGKIWDTLKLAKEEYQLQFQRSMDLQR